MILEGGGEKLIRTDESFLSHLECIGNEESRFFELESKENENWFEISENSRDRG